ncbi:MAG: ABC transporter ATP-binding protein [Candidatus Altiarchaeota archaeon]
MAFIAVKNVSKAFGSKREVLKNIDLKVERGEFVTIFGPNGCGKTTLLNIIAGILKPDGGEVAIDGKDPSEVKIGFVFQNYRDSLLPWKSNLDNIAFPLELEGVEEWERRERANELVETFNLEVPLSHYPYESSGGEQQLVALLREVICEPTVILADEPFSALSYESRNYLRLKIQEIWEKLGLTVLFVSHDVDETVQLGGRVVAMSINPGRICGIHKVTFPRPRGFEVLYKKRFQMIRSALVS